MTDSGGQDGVGVALGAGVPGVKVAALIDALVREGVRGKRVSDVTIGKWRLRGMPGVYDAADACWRYDVAACVAWCRQNLSDGAKHGGERKGAGRKPGAKGQMANGQMAKEEQGTKAEPHPCPSPQGRGSESPSHRLTVSPSHAVTPLEALAIEMAERKAEAERAAEEGKAWEGANKLPVELVRAYLAGEDIFTPGFAEVLAGLSASQHDRLEELIAKQRGAVKAAVERGELVRKAEAQDAARLHAATVRDRIEGLADLLAVRLVGAGCGSDIVELASTVARGVVAEVVGEIEKTLKGEGNG